MENITRQYRRTVKNHKLLGLRLKKLRKLRKISQEQLAEKADISSKYVSRIELGQHFPSLDVLVNFAKILNVDLEEFFSFSDEAKSEKVLRKKINKLLGSVDKSKLSSIIRILNELI